MNAQPYVPVASTPSGRYIFTVDTTGSGVPMRLRLRGGGAPLAKIEAPQGAQKQQPYPLWFRDPNTGQPLCSVQPDGPKSYAVHAADGTPLARLVHRPSRLLPWPRRNRWTAELAYGAGEFTGSSGTWYSWATCILLAPLWIPGMLLVNLYYLFEGDSPEGVGCPSRTVWRGPAGTGLDYRGVGSVYHLAPERIDARIAYPLAALHAAARLR